jgi:hypothetical protein
MKWSILALVLSAFAVRVLADDEAPDKSAYTLFNPTPDDDLRSFNTDRPPKANSPYTVDAGHFQYETDIAVFGYGNTDGVKTEDWTVVDPTLKLGLTNTIDAELQITPYESVVTKSAGNTTSVSGIGDTFARLKINVLGDDRGAVAVALLPYVKLPTAQSGLGNGSIEGGLILPISISAPGGFTVIVMPEGDYLKDTAGRGLPRCLRLPDQCKPSARQALDLLYRALHQPVVSVAGQARIHPGCSPDLCADPELAARLRRQFQPKRRRAADPALHGSVSAVLIHPLELWVLLSCGYRRSYVSSVAGKPCMI